MCGFDGRVEIQRIGRDNDERVDARMRVVVHIVV